jgi:hypothetical protein
VLGLVRRIINTVEMPCKLIGKEAGLEGKGKELTVK